MLRSFKYLLKLTPIQVQLFETWLSACQQLYNAALQERRDAWKYNKSSISYFDQTKSLTQIRAEDPDFANVPSDIERSALARIDKAFKGYFRRCKAGQTPGYPRFRSRQNYNSFNFPWTSLEGDKLLVPKFGQIKLNLYRPLKGTPKEVTIRRANTGQWFVSISCDLGPAPAKVSIKSSIGIDVGLTNFATLSNGETINNPRYFRKAEQRLAKQQQILAKKQKGSKTRQKCKILVAKAHQRIHNQRLDFGRKLACSLFNKYDLVAHEDLKIQQMQQLNQGRFAKSINDAAWGIFLRSLACKAENAGKHLVAVEPRGTSQRCSSCGQIVSKTLKDRVHNCPNCGLRLDRDWNAALNILAVGCPRQVPGMGMAVV